MKTPTKPASRDGAAPSGPVAKRSLFARYGMLVCCIAMTLPIAGYLLSGGTFGGLLDDLALVRPDLILLDLMMPEMNGFEFLVELRGRPELADIPVIVVTAADLTHEDRRRLNGGVEQILRKAGADSEYLFSQLRRLIKSHLGRKQQASALADG